MNFAIYFSLVFLLSELALMLVKRSGRRKTKTGGDRKSLLLFWITIPLSLTLGFFFADYHKGGLAHPALAFSGFAVCVTGVVIRWISIFQLDREFTVDVAISHGHVLKTSGIYKWIRHPAYLGLLLIVSGLAMVMNTLPSVLIVIIPIFIAIIYRIEVEEKALLNEFGEQYKEYSKKTCKIIPGVY